MNAANTHIDVYVFRVRRVIRNVFNNPVVSSGSLVVETIDNVGSVPDGKVVLDFKTSPYREIGLTKNTVLYLKLDPDLDVFVLSNRAWGVQSPASPDAVDTVVSGLTLNLLRLSDDRRVFASHFRDSDYKTYLWSLQHCPLSTAQVLVVNDHRTGSDAFKARVCDAASHGG